jgi:hypothetical protein
MPVQGFDGDLVRYDMWRGLWYLMWRGLGYLVWRGLYYKHMMIVNDASGVISEWGQNLEHHPRVGDYDPRGIIFTHL